jgi:hypothetical protein
MTECDFIDVKVYDYFSEENHYWVLNRRTNTAGNND